MPRRTNAPQDHDIQSAESQTAAPPMKLDVRITSTRNFYDDPTRATATITINDAFAIKGVRVVKGENGLFVSMPARKLRSGEFSEVCHPITSDFARQLNASVLNEYQAHLANQMAESEHTPHIIEPESMEAEPAIEPEMEM